MNRTLLQIAMSLVFTLSALATPAGEIDILKSLSRKGHCCPTQGPPGPPGASGATGPIGPAGPVGPAGLNGVIDYAYYYTVTAQAAIPAGGVVMMTTLDPDHSDGFVAPAGGEVVIPIGGGVYLISYQGTVSATSVGFGISINAGPILPGSVSGSFGTNQRLFGQVIERLNAGDVVRLANAMTATAITTVVPAGSYQAAPTVCSLTFLRLAD